MDVLSQPLSKRLGVTAAPQLGVREDLNDDTTASALLNPLSNPQCGNVSRLIGRQAMGPFDDKRAVLRSGRDWAECEKRYQREPRKAFRSHVGISPHPVIYWDQMQRHPLCQNQD